MISVLMGKTNLCQRYHLGKDQFKLEKEKVGLLTWNKVLNWSVADSFQNPSEKRFCFHMVHTPSSNLSLHV